MTPRQRAQVVAALGDVGIYIPLPWTELTKIVNYVTDPATGFLAGQSQQTVSGQVQAVLDAYPAATKARGEPFQVGTNGEVWIAQTVADATGLSYGVADGILQAIQHLASTGDVSLSTYNPGQFSIGAKVTQAAQSAAQEVKSVAQAVTPQAVQDLVSGAAAGVSATGTLLQFLPLLAVAGLGAWLYIESKPGRSVKSALSRFTR